MRATDPAELSKAGMVPNRKRRCYQRRSGALTRGTGPLRLALAGATRSGSAGVGSPWLAIRWRGYAASKWSQLERQLILGTVTHRDISSIGLVDRIQARADGGRGCVEMAGGTRAVRPARTGAGRKRAPLRRGGGASGYIAPARLRKVFVRRAKSISIWAQKKWHVDGFLIVRKVGIGFRNFV